MEKTNSQIRGVVYKYTLQVECEEKGFCYIGETIDERSRMNKWKNQNKNYAGDKLKSAWDKYGSDVSSTWKYEVLEVIHEADSHILRQKLEDREAYYIKLYNSVEKGYNTSEEGTGNKGVNFSQKHRDNIGAASKGRKHTPETKAQISLTLKLGQHHHTQEAKEKISAGNKGKHRTQEQKEAQSERMKGVDHTALQAGAAEWRKNNEPYWKTHPVSDETKAKIKKIQQEHGIKVEAIFPDGHKEQFTTMKDAADACGVGVGSVSNCVYNGGQCKNGMRFVKT